MSTAIEYPHHMEAEEALIGSVLLNPDCIYELPTDEKEFYIHRHRYLWRAFCSLTSRNIRVDVITVADELERMGKLKQVGGAATLTKLVNRVPSSMHAKEYARLVRDAYDRRYALDCSRKLTLAAHDQNIDILPARSEIADKLTNIQGIQGAVHIRDWLDPLYDQIGEWIKDPRELAGISTGFPDLDHVLGDGLMTGVNLLGGKPGTGKSILAQNIAVNMAENGVPVVFYSAEMNKQDLALRILSAKAQVKVSDFRRGDVEDKMPAVLEKIEEIIQWRLYVHDPKGMTAAELQADLTRLKIRHSIQAVFFDYLELLGDEYAGMKDWERAARLARKLVMMMSKLDLKALVIHKLNKDGWHGKPDLQHFAGGSDLSYDVVSALVLVEHIPDEGQPANASYRTVINVKPQRLVQETRDACVLWKDPDYPRFGLAARQAEAEAGLAAQLTWMNRKDI